LPTFTRDINAQAMLRYLGVTEWAEMLDCPPTTANAALSTLGPGDQTQVLDKGSRIVVTRAAHALSIVGSQVLRPGRCYYIRVEATRADESVAAPTKIRWGFIREAACEVDKLLEPGTAIDERGEAGRGASRQCWGPWRVSVSPIAWSESVACGCGVKRLSESS
jgi:hypothetical protein